MNTREQFERAISDESYRQDFVKEIDLSGADKYVKKIVYEPKQRIYPNGNTPIMDTRMPLRAHFNISGGRSNIHVYPEAFNKKVHFVLDDFLSTLIDHEILGHAKFGYDGENPFKEDEERALRNHLELLKKRNCSPQYKTVIIRRYMVILSEELN